MPNIYQGSGPSNENAPVPQRRRVDTTWPLQGGGALTEDLNLTFDSSIIPAPTRIFAGANIEISPAPLTASGSIGLAADIVVRTIQTDTIWGDQVRAGVDPFAFLLSASDRSQFLNGATDIGFLLRPGFNYALLGSGLVKGALQIEALDELWNGTRGDAVVLNLPAFQRSTAGPNRYVTSGELSVGGTGTPGAPTQSVQYNAGGGNFGGDAKFTYDPSLLRIAVSGGTELRFTSAAGAEGVIIDGVGPRLGSVARLQWLTQPAASAGVVDVKLWRRQADQLGIENDVRVSGTLTVGDIAGFYPSSAGPIGSTWALVGPGYSVGRVEFARANVGDELHLTLIGLHSEGSDVQISGGTFLRFGPMYQGSVANQNRYVTSGEMAAGGGASVASPTPGLQYNASGVMAADAGLTWQWQRDPKLLTVSGDTRLYGTLSLGKNPGGAASTGPYQIFAGAASFDPTGGNAGFQYALVGSGRFDGHLQFSPRLAGDRFDIVSPVIIRAPVASDTTLALDVRAPAEVRDVQVSGDARFYNRLAAGAGFSEAETARQYQQFFGQGTDSSGYALRLVGSGDVRGTVVWGAQDPSNRFQLFIPLDIDSSGQPGPFDLRVKGTTVLRGNLQTSGTVLVQGGGPITVMGAAEPDLQFQTGSIKIASDNVVFWSSTTDATGPADITLQRQGPGTLRIDEGLRVNALQVSGQSLAYGPIWNRRLGASADRYVTSGEMADAFTPPKIINSALIFVGSGAGPPLFRDDAALTFQWQRDPKIFTVSGTQLNYGNLNLFGGFVLSSGAMVSEVFALTDDANNPMITAESDNVLFEGAIRFMPTTIHGAFRSEVWIDDSADPTLGLFRVDARTVIERDLQVSGGHQRWYDPRLNWDPAAILPVVGQLTVSGIVTTQGLDVHALAGGPVYIRMLPTTGAFPGGVTLASGWSVGFTPDPDIAAGGAVNADTFVLRHAPGTLRVGRSQTLLGRLVVGALQVSGDNALLYGPLWQGRIGTDRDRYITSGEMAAAAGAPGGNTGNVQYNAGGGTFGGDAALNWNAGADVLAVSGQQIGYGRADLRQDLRLGYGGVLTADATPAFVSVGDVTISGGVTVFFSAFKVLGPVTVWNTLADISAGQIFTNTATYLPGKPSTPALGSFITLQDVPTLVMSGKLTQYATVNAAPTIQPDRPGAQLRITELAALRSAPSISGNFGMPAQVLERNDIHILDSRLSYARVGRHTGLHVDPLATADTSWAIGSEGPLTPSFHAGPVLVGVSGEYLPGAQFHVVNPGLIARPTLLVSGGFSRFDGPLYQGGVSNPQRYVTSGEMAAGGGTPAGQAFEVQWNSDPAGSFDSDATLRFNPADAGVAGNSVLAVSGTIDLWRQLTVRSVGAPAGQLAVQIGAGGLPDAITLASGWGVAFHRDPDLTNAVGLPDTKLLRQGPATIRVQGLAGVLGSLVTGRLQISGAGSLTYGPLFHKLIGDGTARYLTSGEIAAGAATSPAGNDRDVQFNNAGSFGGGDELRWHTESGQSILSASGLVRNLGVTIAGAAVQPAQARQVVGALSIWAATDDPADEVARLEYPRLALASGCRIQFSATPDLSGTGQGPQTYLDLAGPNTLRLTSTLHGAPDTGLMVGDLQVSGSNGLLVHDGAADIRRTVAVASKSIALADSNAPTLISLGAPAASDTVTLSGAFTFAFAGVSLGGKISYANTLGLAAFALFGNTAVFVPWQPSPAMATFSVLLDNPVLAISGRMQRYVALTTSPTIGADRAGANWNLAEFNAVRATLTLSGASTVGANVAERNDLRIDSATLKGATIDRHIGLFVRPLTDATRNWAVGSEGTQTHSFHAGSFIFGASGLNHLGAAHQPDAAVHIFQTVSGRPAQRIETTYGTLVAKSYTLQGRGHSTGTAGIRVLDVPTIQDHSYLLDCSLLGRRSDTGSNTGAYRLLTSWKNAAGVVSQIGTTNHQFVVEDDATWTPMVFTSGINPARDLLLLCFSGAGGSTVELMGEVKVFVVSGA